jgi:hypothetical protein
VNAFTEGEREGSRASEGASFDARELDYVLPDERIAQQPLAERDAARLLCMPRAEARFEHHVVTDPQGVGQLAHRRGSVELAAQRLRRGGDPGRQLLGGAGHLRRPRVVPEVALDLADDGRDGERGEARAAVDVESLHGLDETLEGDLLEVVERLAAAEEPPGQAAREAFKSAKRNESEPRDYADYMQQHDEWGVDIAKLRALAAMGRAE